MKITESPINETIIDLPENTKMRLQALLHQQQEFEQSMNEKKDLLLSGFLDGKGIEKGKKVEMLWETLQIKVTEVPPQ